MKRLIKVSMFKRARYKMTCGTISLWDWLLERNSYTPLVEMLRQETIEEKRKKIKDLLPAVTISCICSERFISSITEYTNLICIDIDGKDNPSISDMEELKQRLGKLPYVMYCGLSASGNGVFCIIPYEDYKKHKLYFNALERDFRNMGIIVDSSCSDICRLRFYSYDEHPYINFEVKTYSNTLEKSEFTRIKYERVIHKQSCKRSISTESSKNISLEDFLLQPSNLDFTSATPLSKIQEVERLLNLVIERQVDITPIYNDWIRIGLVIKNLFEDKGLDLFLKVSSFYPNYTQEEAENKYFELDERKYRVNSQSLFDIAAKYGIYK